MPAGGLPAAPHPPFVGRGQELERLGGLLRRGHGLVVVSGEGGVGKSRLVREALRQRAGLLVLRGEAPPIRTTQPLLALAEALESPDPAVLGLVVEAAEAVPAALRPGLAVLLPHTVGRRQPHRAHPLAVSRRRLVAGVEELLAGLTKHRRVVLVVENAHWADRDTLELLAQLGRDPGHPDVVVVATCRDDERPVAMEMRAWYRAVRRNADVTEVPLTALRRPEVADLVRGWLPGTDDDVVGQVFRRSEGNPFLAEQLALAVRNAGRLGVRQRVGDFLHDRVLSCGRAAGELMTVLALAGRALPVDRLADVAGLDEAGCRAAVEGLAEAMLAEADEGGVRCRHPLVGEAWLMHGPVSTRAVEGRLGELLEAFGDEVTAAEAAAHYRSAGRPADELRMAERAAARARALASDAEAARWWRRCLELRSGTATAPVTGTGTAARPASSTLTTAPAPRTARLLPEQRQPTDAPGHLSGHLSGAGPGKRLGSRELAVLRLVAAGRTNTEIARTLAVTPSTVSSHVTSLVRKLDVAGRAEAAAWAREAGLLEGSDEPD